MLEFILFVLIIVLFVKISNANDRIDYLTNRISQIDSHKLRNTPYEPIVKEEKQEEQTIFPQKETDNSLEPLIKTKKENIQVKAEKIPQIKEQEIFSYTTQEQTTKEQIEKEAPSTEVQFTAAKLFSWIAGFAFILAIIFGLIYAVQNEIISKQMITAFAGLTGLVLLGIGLKIKDENLQTAAGTLCASGITTFFIATYCAFALYNMLSLPIAFILMALVSFSSFFISVKKDIQFIGLLGMIAAFITPLLLSNGQDNYIFFFTYIAFINGAAMAAALKKGWNNLLLASLFFTFLCQIAWLAKDFNPQRATVFQIIFTVYSIALTIIYFKLKEVLPLFIKYLFSAFIILGAICILPLMVSYLLINFLILITISTALVFILYYSEPSVFRIPAYFISVIFLFSLFIWTDSALATQANGLLLLLAILGASLANSLVISSKTKELFAPVVNLLALFIIFISITNKNLHTQTLDFVHVGVILFNLALFSVAYKFRQKLETPLKTAFGSYMVASLIFTFLFITQASTATDFSSVFTNIFIVNIALLFLTFKDGKPYKLPLQICAFGILIILYYMLSIKNAFLPFGFSTYLLLGGLNLFTALQLADKEDENIFPLVFAGAWFVSLFNTTNMYYIWFAAIFLNLISLSFARAYKKPELSLIAALGSAFIFMKAHDAYAIIIACAFFFLFFIYPFLCKKDFKEDSWQPWCASVLMGFVAWYITITYKTFALDLHKGLISLPFGALFLFAGAYLYKETLQNKYKTPFTLMGIASVFFITAALAYIFTEQWLTVALAIEGAALIVLNKKVPTAWGQKIGFCLLFLAFLRLILIGDYGSYYILENKIFNWYLFVYGLSAAAMFSAAKFWQPEEKDNTNISNIFNIAGAILLFLLVDIEIANYFGNTGEILKFNFFGNFAAAITYTIAWTLYGAIICLIAFYNKRKTLLNIGTVIMILSIIKLFMFDLWSLGILYRIIGLFAMAGILFGISLIFQKFKDRVRE